MMFESVIRAVLPHKQVTIIAALAITGLAASMLPGNMLAFAQAPEIDRDIEIPCQPGCPDANEPKDVVKGPGPVTVRFSFLPCE